MAEILAETIADDFVVNTLKDVATEGVVHLSSSVITDFVFYSFLYGAIGITFLSTQSWLIHAFFNHHGHGIPVPGFVIEIGANLADVFMVLSITSSSWELRNPAAGEDSEIYSSYLSLYIAIMGLKAIWGTLLWRYHAYPYALIVSIFAGFATWVAVLSEVFIWGFHGTTVSLASIGALILYTGMFAFNLYIAIRHYKGNPVVAKDDGLIINSQDQAALNKSPQTFQSGSSPLKTNFFGAQAVRK